MNLLPGFAVWGFQVPLPIVALGLVTGATYGVLAVGLVLVYRANRLINFAHGEIGAFAAALLGVAVVQHHITYWLAFPVALALGAGTGALTEVAVVRRLRNVPRLMSLVATLGAAQILLALQGVASAQARTVTHTSTPAAVAIRLPFDLVATRATAISSAEGTISRREARPIMPSSTNTLTMR